MNFSRPIAAAALALGCGTVMATDAVRVVGTTLTLALSSGHVLTGQAVSGKEVRIDNLQMRISAVHEGHGRVPWLYDVEVRAGDAWQGVCTQDAQGRRLALFLAGSIADDGRFMPDPQRLSVTCTSGALGKCLLSGYEPSGKGLARFQACIRMFRADYCGDGRSWTKDGTVIDVFDRAGIQQPTERHLPLEAAWGPEGAVCVHHTRVPARITMSELHSACPRAFRVSPKRCNELTASGLADALVFNRSADLR